MSNENQNLVQVTHRYQDKEETLRGSAAVVAVIGDDSINFGLIGMANGLDLLNLITTVARNTTMTLAKFTDNDIAEARQVAMKFIMDDFIEQLNQSEEA